MLPQPVPLGLQELVLGPRKFVSEPKGWRSTWMEGPGALAEADLTSLLKSEDGRRQKVADR